MLRRHFLRSLVELCGLVALSNVVRAEVLPSARILQTSLVAGFQYHDGERVWPLLLTGDSPQLMREAHNPFDTNAVRIEWENHKLGYVPRIENHTIAQLLDRGETLTAHIVGLNDSSDPWQRVRFDVMLDV